MMAGPKVAEASTITLATPAGLQPGDTFRYMFVTNSVTTPASTSINNYDSLVSSEVSYFGVEYNGVPITGCRAVVSTEATSARQHIAITETPSFRGIYNAIGEQIATSQTSSPGGLWSGLLINPVRWTIDGLQPVSDEIYTGSLANGDSWYYYMGGGPYKDDRYPGAISVGFAQSRATRTEWIYSERFRTLLFGFSEDFWPKYTIYGITPLLTVPGGPSAVPEIDPAIGGSALSLVAGVLAMIEQRRRRAKLVA